MILFGLGGMSIGAIIYWKNKKTGEESIEEKQLEED